VLAVCITLSVCENNLLQSIPHGDDARSLQDAVYIECFLCVCIHIVYCTPYILNASCVCVYIYVQYIAQNPTRRDTHLRRVLNAVYIECILYMYVYLCNVLHSGLRADAHHKFEILAREGGVGTEEEHVGATEATAAEGVRGTEAAARGVGGGEQEACWVRGLAVSANQQVWGCGCGCGCKYTHTHTHTHTQTHTHTHTHMETGGERQGQI
jgi:hypothetical protein